MVYKFDWKPGSRIRVKASVAGKHILALEKKAGTVTPERLLNSVRSKSNPLHGEFEWDDIVAGEKFRLQQATHMICCLVIETGRVDASGKSKMTRAMISIDASADDGPGRDGGRIYLNVSRVMKSRGLRTQVIERAWEELKVWEGKYNDLVEFAQVFGAIPKHMPKPIKAIA